jgi:hypothetical protein
MPPRGKKRKSDPKVEAPKVEAPKVEAPKVEAPKRRGWADTVRDEMRDSLLPPIVEMMLPYCQSDRWLFVGPSKRSADGKGRRLIMYDPEQRVVTMDRPTFVDLYDGRDYTGQKGHLTQMIVPYRKALYFVSSPATSIQWGGGVDPNGDKGGIYRFVDPSVLEDHVIDTGNELNTGHEWLDLVPLMPPHGCFSSPFIVTSDSLFVRVAFKASWQRFDFSTETWDANISVIPQELQCGERSYIVGVAVGARSFLAIDGTYFMIRCYTYDESRTTRMVPVEMNHLNPLPFFSSEYITSTRLGDELLIIHRHHILMFHIRTESPLVVDPPVIINTGAFPKGWLIGENVITISEGASLLKIHLPTLLTCPGQPTQWMEAIGPAPRLLLDCFRASLLSLYFHE